MPSHHTLEGSGDPNHPELEETSNHSDDASSTESSPGHHHHKTTQSVRFRGRCDDLEGCVFALGTDERAFCRNAQELCRYVGQHYTLEARRALETLQTPAFLPPRMPTTTGRNHGSPIREKTEAELTYLEKKTLELELKRHLEQKDQCERDLHQIYALIEGQCTEAVMEALALEPGYPAARTRADPMLLLGILKTVCCRALPPSKLPKSLFSLVPSGTMAGAIRFQKAGDGLSTLTHL